MTDEPIAPSPPEAANPEPEVPDELAARRAQLLAELDDVEQAIAESGATPPAAGSDAETPGGTPAPGSAPSVADVEAARSAAPAPAAPAEPEAADEPENGTQDGSEPVESTEPEPGSPAEPADVMAARSAPPAPVNQAPN